MVLSACQITGSIISSLAAYFGYRKPGENPTQTEQSKLEEKKEKCNKTKGAQLLELCVLFVRQSEGDAL